MLDKIGLSEIWTNQETNLNLAGFKTLIKTKLHDINKQDRVA